MIMWRYIAGLLATTTLGGGALYGADQRVNPYEDKGTHFELDIKAEIEQGERVEISKTEPKVDLIFWNDEERVSIKPLFPQTFGAAIEENITAHRPLLSKQMQFKKGDITAFVEPKEGSEGEFDIDFTLDAIPQSNVFEYKIEGADQLDFFYQPELTPEEIADGAERPENVVGSYAVYHKEKANHRIGSTNYATGKAFHIFRPKAIDANGSEVWAELSYLEGVLAVTVPEKWLETAAYPVRVDPTFGFTSIGGTQNVFVRDQSFGNLYASTEAGNVTKLTIYTLDQNVSSHVKGLIYNDSSGVPNNLLGVTPEVIPGHNGSAQWDDYTFSSSVAVTATNYHLGFIQSGSDAAANIYYRDVGSTNQMHRVNDSYASPASVYPGSPTPADRKLSIYATYTAAAAAATTITPTTILQSGQMLLQGGTVILQ